MKRKNLEQILKEEKVDLKREYERLYHLFYTENIQMLKQDITLHSENFALEILCRSRSGEHACPWMILRNLKNSILNVIQENLI
ncbi:MAG: hypothetical protein KH269_12480 [Faecalibacterium prausnitzii]|nr:hypothetical protein [Faecalibacterium prausnitzii]